METADDQVLISLSGITKRFPGVLALENVSLDVRKGEVLALVGENGAGKSTLIKILSGLYQKDSGEITVKGQSVEINSTKDAQSLGISTIFQEPSLAPHLNAVQNVYLGRELLNQVMGKALRSLNEKAMYQETARLYKKFFPTVEDLVKPVSELDALKNRVIEIVKALSIECSVVIMDEPTAALAEHEREVLFDFIRLLKAQGVSIIYVSHHLRELFLLADRITVMRDGKNVATVNKDDTNIDQLVSMMVGRELSNHIVKEKVALGKTVLEVADLNRDGYLRDINFHIRQGEIVGIAGLAGSGRTETVRAVIGADPSSGTVRVDGRAHRIRSPRDAIKAGIGLLPENRKLHGALIELSVANNITMAAMDRVVSNKLVLKKKKESAIAEDYVERLGIKTPHVNQKVRFLSGGNQQKVILAKWLFTQPKILIFDEPTQGIDVGAKVEVYHLIAEFVRNGGAVLMVSSELPELMGLSDRIYVMHKGKFVHEFSREEATEENIMMYASGGHE
ncbi:MULTISPECIES: sugar ABC transporter ATP-binding protein [unclassified Paenibacillus]|uniref:sugar ABC transporter ATP-binding protein n=1 Tax=unclassified Paenibacillus TaxID=185978 RepID=UPI002406FFCD|nr:MULTISPECIES: sugar ABC transporter ATP-binding protein [unclassified Paenibacillus]MDF9841744.1 ribose transport system ATP-binding protein [Paenibacillus sp. PastF-2]MDF9848144.1 ribose transport system ATP-binding protein [Paenibacillus sp. PastM-2]MDF9854903.1 ribose transport system ATP-binding protein [Paenibacillus sp. PastF-1]MDH6480173.1 ribose transport system ATP-binding protein [Paenibacillus sp. PastH-2]MDH6507603.1 ribose transport system ATP-binding protein [Paenibacillus sp.